MCNNNSLLNQHPAARMHLWLPTAMDSTYTLPSPLSPLSLSSNPRWTHQLLRMCWVHLSRQAGTACTVNTPALPGDPCVNLPSSQVLAHSNNMNCSAVIFVLLRRIICMLPLMLHQHTLPFEVAEAPDSSSVRVRYRVLVEPRDE
jgi:hypothetical protein